jgi:hypothetical protein
MNLEGMNLHQAEVLPNDLLKEDGRRRGIFQPGQEQMLRLLEGGPVPLGLRLFDGVGLLEKAIPKGIPRIPVPQDRAEFKATVAGITNQDVLFIDTDVALDQLKELLPPRVKPLVVQIPRQTAATLSAPTAIEGLIRQAERVPGRFFHPLDVIGYKGSWIAVLSAA